MKINLFLAMAAMALSACQKDDNILSEGGNQSNPLPTEMATVHFQANASKLSAGLKTKASQVYNDINQLRIMAFRNNGSDFFYIGDVKKDSIQYDEAKSAFTGSAQLPVGNYKFIPAYGLPAIGDANNIGISTLNTNTAYGSALTVTHKGGILPAIFLQAEDVDVKEHTLGVAPDVTNKPVELAMTRSVARVDIQIVKGEKNAANTAYVEKEGNVFDPDADLKSMTLTFKGLNPSVQLFNGQLTTAAPITSTFTVPTNARTNGTGGATIYGKAKGEIPYDYENIAQTDFINGSAHFYGPFLFPYGSVNEGADLDITLVSKPDVNNGQSYQRTIRVNSLPLSRNKVTLVKIYVPGDDVFHTKVEIEVTVNKAWETHQESSGSAE